LTAKKKKAARHEKKEAAQTEGAAPEVDEKVTELEQALSEAQQEIDELKEKLLRAHAEMDNLRKRTRREVEDAHKYGMEKFATALLDVVDNLERALQVDEGNEQGLREGVRLTLESWQEMMKRFHLERIDGVGQPFDPHVHEALSQMPSDEPQGTIIAQHVAGYTLHGRLIRPAKVLVSSGPAGDAENDSKS